MLTTWFVNTPPARSNCDPYPIGIVEQYGMGTLPSTRSKASDSRPRGGQAIVIVKQFGIGCRRGRSRAGRSSAGRSSVQVERWQVEQVERAGRAGRALAGRAGRAGRALAGRALAGRAGRAGRGGRSSAGRSSAGRSSAGRSSAGRSSAGRSSAGRSSAGRSSAGAHKKTLTRFGLDLRIGFALVYTYRQAQRAPPESKQETDDNGHLTDESRKRKAHCR